MGDTVRVNVAPPPVGETLRARVAAAFGMLTPAALPLTSPLGQLDLCGLLQWIEYRGWWAQLTTPTTVGGMYACYLGRRDNGARVGWGACLNGGPVLAVAYAVLNAAEKNGGKL